MTIGLFADPEGHIDGLMQAQTAEGPAALPSTYRALALGAGIEEPVTGNDGTLRAWVV